jgi:hemolysin activation/secretion protein
MAVPCQAGAKGKNRTYFLIGLQQLRAGNSGSFRGQPNVAMIWKAENFANPLAPHAIVPPVKRCARIAEKHRQGFAAVVGLTLWSSAVWADAPRPLDIEEFRVEGNTVLPIRDVEEAVYDFLGPDRSPADVEKARAALEDLYQKRGYPTVTVEVPRQAAGSGIIRIIVTERRIGRLRVVGARYHEPDKIRTGAPSLAPGTVPNVNDVRRDMLAVTPDLRGGRDPDTMDVDLNVTDPLPLHESIELNNRRSVDTTPLRLIGSLGYDNLWQRGDSIGIFFEVAPENPSDALVFSGSYTFRIPGTDLSLVASYLKSDSNVASVGGTDVVGKGQIAGLRLMVPLRGLDGFTHNLAIGGDYKDFAQSLTLAGQGNRVPLVYYPVTLGYNASWTAEKSHTDLTAAAVMGTPEFGGSAAELEANRAYASASFFYLRASVVHTSELPLGMQFWTRVQGQASGNSLVPNEQFPAGGVDTVRGYLEAEVLGDNAAGFQMELRSPSFAQAISPRLNELRVHLFADAAETSINQPLADQRRAYGLSSVGFGIRVRFADHASAAFENAVTLSDASTTKHDADALLFRVLGDF